MHLKLFLILLFIFLFFLSRNRPNIHNNINDISSPQNVVNDYFSLTVFYLKSKVVEGSHKGKICFLIFGQFFSKSTCLRLWHFFLTQWLSNKLNFSVAVHIYKIRVFDEAFFLLTIRMPMITKLFKVVTWCKELSPLYMHDISTESSCRVTWQMKYVFLPAEDVSISH